MIVFQIFLGLLSLAGIIIFFRGIFKMPKPSKHTSKLQEGEAPSIWFPGQGQMWGGIFLFIVAASLLGSTATGS